MTTGAYIHFQWARFGWSPHRRRKGRKTNTKKKTRDDDDQYIHFPSGLAAAGARLSQPTSSNSHRNAGATLRRKMIGAFPNFAWPCQA